MSACAGGPGYGQYGPYGRDYREPVPPVRIGPDTSRPADPLARSVDGLLERVEVLTARIAELERRLAQGDGPAEQAPQRPTNGHAVPPQRDGAAAAQGVRP